MKKCNRGFSIIEIMVGLGLLAVGTYFGFSALRDSLLQQKGVQATDDARSINNDMISLLSDPQACLNTFGGGEPTVGFARDKVLSHDGATLYALNGKYGNNTLQLKKIQVGGPDVDTRTGITKWVPAGAAAGSALALVTWEKIGGAQGPREITRFFKVGVGLDSAKKIITCQVESAAAPGEMTLLSYPVRLSEKSTFVGLRTEAPTMQPLAAGVPASAKAIYLRVFCSQSSIAVRDNTNTPNPHGAAAFTTVKGYFICMSRNNAAQITSVWLPTKMGDPATGLRDLVSNLEFQFENEGGAGSVAVDLMGYQ